MFCSNICHYLVHCWCLLVCCLDVPSNVPSGVSTGYICRYCIQKMFWRKLPFAPIYWKTSFACSCHSSLAHHVHIWIYPIYGWIQYTCPLAMNLFVGLPAWWSVELASILKFKAWKFAFNFRFSSKKMSPGISSKCHQCSDIFESNLELKQHVYQMHTAEHFICTQCGIYLASPRFLKKHISRKHRNSCQLCAKEFPSDSRLKQHELAQTRCTPKDSHELPFRCKTFHLWTLQHHIHSIIPP